MDSEGSSGSSSWSSGVASSSGSNRLVGGSKTSTGLRESPLMISASSARSAGFQRLVSFFGASCPFVMDKIGDLTPSSAIVRRTANRSSTRVVYP